MSHDGKYLIVFVEGAGSGHLIYYVDLEKNGEINKPLTLIPITTEPKNTFGVSESAIILFTRNDLYE